MSLVILVNENDEPLGEMDKLAAHQKGLLHRAFSVFITNSQGQLLLQQRAVDKYHGGGLWTNTCCSHPMPGEPTVNAAHRRLQEEMGFSTNLTWVHSFVYHAAVENNLIEHEYDHVFIGTYPDLPIINTEEVMAFRYASFEQIEREIKLYPSMFTVWFKQVLPTVKQKFLEANYLPVYELAS